MKLFVAVICAFLCTYVYTMAADKSWEEKTLPLEDENNEHKRDGGITAAIIGAAITAGASLVGTTVSALQASAYSIAVSGSLENYSKWPMFFKGCEVNRGYMNIPMRSVAPGQREGFAGHKNGHTTTGNWVRCSFTVNGIYAHFMYSAPYNFNHYSNWMSVAVCGSDEKGCTSLSASNMYYNYYSYMARREYYYNVHTVKICNRGFCMKGVMGTNHTPVIDLKLMPIEYDDLCNAAKDASLKERWNKDDYAKFVRS